jgi:hypothetical protein
MPHSGLWNMSSYLVDTPWAWLLTVVRISFDAWTWRLHHTCSELHHGTLITCNDRTLQSHTNLAQASSNAQRVNIFACLWPKRHHYDIYILMLSGIIPSTYVIQIQGCAIFCSQAHRYAKSLSCHAVFVVKMTEKNASLKVIPPNSC